MQFESDDQVALVLLHIADLLGWILDDKEHAVSIKDRHNLAMKNNTVTVPAWTNTSIPSISPSPDKCDYTAEGREL